MAVQSSTHPATPPLVSIIIPLYNHAKFIADTLTSVLMEGHPNFEVLIIDDGSSDGSFQVAQAWFDSHPGAFFHTTLERQENQGITKTLNRLLQQSQGEFISMVASDDLLLPGGITARLQALSSRPDWLAVFGDAIMIDEHGQQLASSALRKIGQANISNLLSDRLRRQELIARWSVPGPVLLYRRSTIGHLGGYDESAFVEDRGFYLRLLAENALGFINMSVASYRWHRHNAIKNNKNMRRTYQAMHRAEILSLSGFEGRERQLLMLVAEHSRQNLLRLTAIPMVQVLASLRLLILECKLFWQRLLLDLQAMHNSIA